MNNLVSLVVRRDAFHSLLKFRTVWEISCDSCSRSQTIPRSLLLRPVAIENDVITGVEPTNSIEFLFIFPLHFMPNLNTRLSCQLWYSYLWVPVWLFIA